MYLLSPAINACHLAAYRAVGIVETLFQPRKAKAYFGKKLLHQRQRNILKWLLG
jgi:hypothetical protein